MRSQIGAGARNQLTRLEQHRVTTYPRKRRIWPAIATVLAVAFCATGLALAVMS